MRHTGKRWIAAGIAAMLPVLLAVLPLSASAGAQDQMIIGLDMQPATNGPDTLGRLQPCTEAETGAEFSADIFIGNVPSLAAWELRLDYDPDVVSVELADYNQMLVSTQPSGSVFPSLFEPERAGRYFMAATEINGTPDSGSGVLAHVTFKAVGPGQSTLSITGTPTSHGPRLTGAGGAPIGDDNGDGIWDGQLTKGTVYVGSDCPASTPIPTPQPGGGSGGNPPSGTGGGPDSASGGAAVAVVDSDPAGDSNGSDGAGSGDVNSVDDQSNDDATGQEPDSPIEDGEPAGAGASPSRSSGADDNGLGDIPFVVGGLALGAIALGAGTLFVFRRRGTW